ncbi:MULTISPECIES: TetR/AcrR family transcriptional regulator [Caulobacter]|jgi:AcrR family transcriptional regulator|uniref:Transcriptional regulator, TetR family n=1 Tax=Caulobacter vibrioides OR37 TaxID=1292034 RepID=R0D0U2_CAUVI|nr:MULTISPECIES: TetR/AcrR family transcriptional regulator [Caulobacter]ENZ82261.1 transcriptional regulator, TetR family [Caulobacter vibrioides OR37]MBQ1563015.1 TetR/AcrR family transcriptional regulator [Caulobacter sp.]
MRVKSEEKRLAILEAAKSVFLERGYDSASMAEVSARVGGSKQTLYSYFASKEDLFVAVMIEKGAAQVQPLFDILHENDNLAEAIHDFVLAFLRFITTDEVVAFRRIVYAEGAKSDLGKLFYENGPKRGWTRMAEDFEQAMDAGRMRRADPWTAVYQLHALCEAGPVQRLLEGSGGPIDEATLLAVADAATDTFIRAYEVQAR